jgi:hypothetical protein
MTSSPASGECSGGIQKRRPRQEVAIQNNHGKKLREKGGREQKGDITTLRW